VRSDFDRKWEEMSQEVITGMKEWRLQHPKATLSEIEQALDQRLANLRARMLEDLALASAAANPSADTDQQPLLCPHCDEPLESRGQKVRHLKTHHNQQLSLLRSYAVCPRCQVGFFPPG
jgi:hypothetical protein